MKSSISLSSITRPVARFFNRFHVLIYTLTVIVGVSIATLALIQLLSQPAPGNQTNVNPKFDVDTIRRIESMDSSKSDFTLPPGRINPLAD